MILKKYKIGPVGNLIVVYKRVQKNKDHKTKCSLCGIKDCTTIKISSSSELLHLSLAVLCKTADALRKNRESYIIYVPWKIR